MPIPSGSEFSSTHNRKYDGLVRPDGLVHRSVYTDPAIFEEEMTKVFAANWTFLAHESEIPQANDFKLVTVGRRSTIVTRTSDGKFHALLNRCTHRASPVCLEERGNASRFNCPYHGWTFTNAGDLMAVSFPEGYPKDFDRAAHNLGRFPRVESYRGYIFGSLNADVEPFMEWLGPARATLDWSIDRDCEVGSQFRVVKSVQMVYNGNWKHQNDNNTDGYHTPFLHKATNTMNRLRHGPGRWLSHVRDDTGMVCQYLGHGHKLGDHRPMVTSVWDQSRPYPGREAEAASLTAEKGDAARDILEYAGRAGINLIIYPNLFIMGNGTFAVFEPVAVDRTNIRYYATLIDDAPAQLNRLRLRFEEDFHSVGSRDDSDIQERVQHALTTIPEMEWLDISRGMNRQTVSADGVITSDKTDDTAIRGAYGYWLELMNRDVRISVA